MKWSAEIYIKPEDVWDCVPDVIEEGDTFEDMIACDEFDQTGIYLFAREDTVKIAVFQDDDIVEEVEVYGG